MIIHHNGNRPPFVRNPMRVSDVEWWPTSWGDLMTQTEETSQSIISFSVELPSGFELIDSHFNIPYKVDGIEFNHVCSALIRAPSVEGVYYIKYKIGTAITTGQTQVGGESITRGFYLKVKDFA